MSEYTLNVTAFLDLAEYLANACAAGQKSYRSIPARFQGKRESVPVYQLGFLREPNDTDGRQCWIMSFRTQLVIKRKMWDGIQKSLDTKRNVNLLGDGKTISLTDFRIYDYVFDSELQGDLVAIYVNAASLFKFHAYGDYDAVIAGIVKKGNQIEI